MTEFAKKIKDLRLQKGWTKKELAIQTGLSLPVLVNLEKGERVSDLTVAKLAKTLDYDFNELLKLKDK